MDNFVQVLGHAQADMSTTLHVKQADKLHQDAAVFGTLALCCVGGAAAPLGRCARSMSDCTVETDCDYRIFSLVYYAGCVAANK